MIVHPIITSVSTSSSQSSSRKKYFTLQIFPVKAASAHSLFGVISSLHSFSESTCKDDDQLSCPARERNYVCLFHFLSSDSVRKKKWETSWPTCWKSSRELRRMAGRLRCLCPPTPRQDHHQAGADLLSVSTRAIFAKLFSLWRPAPSSLRPSKEGESQG